MGSLPRDMLSDAIAAELSPQDSEAQSLCHRGGVLPMA
jgi:hypothetical protein